MTVGGNVEFTLTILGRAEYNGTSVQFVAEYGGEEKTGVVFESQTATLTIQGVYKYIYIYIYIHMMYIIMGVR